ncbi:hypothetical protein HRI_004682900 [Hibiscus trionum]|uniref:BZIP domain-containing protein n=1 Tax=Hibiscus trionum TaxID=183268 RepID=A0A9W7MRK1_HIBTR|nr:hypothetical protein HRI_004682900 [Hibiscus trionum]
MDDTTSEATSPYSASGMEYSSINNQSYYTYQWPLHPQMNDGMTHSQATRDHFLQGEASQQPRPGGRRPKMTIDERKVRKRQIDADHRRRKKAKFDEMTALNQSLQDQNGQLSTENRHLKEETGRLSSENRHLKEETGRLSSENRHLKEETGRLSSENRHLKEETGRLSFENRHLEDHIKGLRSKGQLPQEVLQTHDSYISQPTSQVEQNVYVQDHYGTESNNDDRVYSSHQYMEYTHTEGAADAFDGLGIDELLNLLPLENEMTPCERFPIHESGTEHRTSSQSGLSPAEVAEIKLHKFLVELDAEVTSNVDPSDFTGLEGEQRSVGRFRIPASLIQTVERIENFYGDVSATSLISPSVSGTIYVFFCATIKEMECLQLGEVTERIMLKWRDVIKDALRLNFDVTFAMEHLKTIACAYFGLTGHRLLQDIGAKISTLEAEMKEWKEKHTRIYTKSQMSIGAAEKFIGVPVSTGLFPPSSSNRIMHCRN